MLIFKEMLRKFGLHAAIFVISIVFLVLGFKGSASLSYIFLVTWWKLQLVYSRFVIFISMLGRPYSKKVFILLSVVNAILTLVFLKALVINLVSPPMYVNFAHLIFSSCTRSFFLCFISFIIEGLYLLLHRIFCVVCISFCLFSGDISYVIILLWR